MTVSANDRQVLEALSQLDHGEGPTIRELCAWLQIQHDLVRAPSTSVVHRALAHLEAAGLVVYDEGYHVVVE